MHIDNSCFCVVLELLNLAGGYQLDVLALHSSIVKLSTIVIATSHGLGGTLISLPTTTMPSRMVFAPVKLKCSLVVDQNHIFLTFS